MDDGLPQTLSGWILHNGLTHIKIKLAGDDLAWISTASYGSNAQRVKSKRAQGKNVGVLSRL